MIDRLIFKNFQNISEARIALERVTTFVGPSDSGKTARLRGLRWLAENKPAGDAFIRDGEKGCSVAARVDGQWVVRSRSDKENVYEFNGELYQSLKATSVPTAIAELLNMGEVNYQSQLSAPFWLSDTGGAVAQNLNAVINLGEIDAALARAAATVRDLRAKEKLIQERLTAAQATAAAREWTVAAMAEWSAVEKVKDDRDACMLMVGEWEAYIREWDALDARVAAKTAEVADGAALVAIGEQLQNATVARAGLAAMIAEYDRYDRILADDPGPAWDELAACRAAGDAAAEATRLLRVLIEDYDTAETGAAQWQNELERLTAELAERTGGVCPTCGQPADVGSFVSSVPTGISTTESPGRGVRQPVRSGGKPRAAT